MHVAENPQMEDIIDQRIGRQNKIKTCFEYLVKWRGHPIKDSSRVNDVDIENHGRLVQDLMDMSP
jgi:hypothetical protein